MKSVSYKCHRFPPDVIRHAVWLYFRFTLSLRDVEELFARCCQVNLPGSQKPFPHPDVHAAVVAAAHV